ERRNARTRELSGGQRQRLMVALDIDWSGGFETDAKGFEAEA
ncbi:MAG: hypothetical protein QOC97_612, partial [Chloroflexota bacterium]|nr:hypothetical protein [Chloroflexota bacterium]